MHAACMPARRYLSASDAQPRNSCRGQSGPDRYTNANQPPTNASLLPERESIRRGNWKLSMRGSFFNDRETIFDRFGIFINENFGWLFSASD